VWPLLHRPTFEADILHLRHQRDLGFGCVVLAVCAVASRYCKDTRVLAKVRKGHGTQQHTTPRLSGFPWEGPDPWIDDLEQGDQGLEDGDISYADGTSSGWKYFDRIQHCHPTMLTPVILTELQTTFVSAQILLILNGQMLKSPLP
jgi:hypothetical protein